MKTVPNFQSIVEQIAQRYGMDPAQPGAYLRLQLPGYGQLVIQHMGGCRVSVTRYVPVAEDYVADPQVVALTTYGWDDGSTGQKPLVWIPLESTDLFGGWRLYVEADDQGVYTLIDPVGQAELARTCERIVAANLRREGWLDRAQRCHTLPPAERITVHRCPQGVEI